MKGLFKFNFIITDIPIIWDNAKHGLNVIYPPPVTSHQLQLEGIWNLLWKVLAGAGSHIYHAELTRGQW